MNLIVVESPTKARTLSKFLGTEYEVIATMGHIKDLPKSKLSIDIENNFEPDYVTVLKKSEVVKKLLSSAKSAKIVFLATDPDREGEAISAHVRDVITDKMGKKTPDLKRITFHEITKTALDTALAKPGVVDQDLVDAQTARRVLDRIVGYKLSPILWKKVRRGLSAGRVQTVAVRLIVEKEKEIKAFRAQEYWDFWVEVLKVGEAKKNAFKAQLAKIEGKKFLVTNKDDADKITADLEKAKYKVDQVKRKEVVSKPYPPFTTSTMTQAAARIMGWSAKKTMNIAQALYEQGFITYHRTDSVNLSTDAINKARTYIAKKYPEALPDNPNFYKVKSKSAQEAHEAIRPTDAVEEIDAKESKFASDELKLYSLIFRRFLSSQMKPAIFDETTIVVEGKTDKLYSLSVTGQVMKFAGWKILYKKADETEAILLPDVKDEDVLSKEKVEGFQKFTLPPARFTEASLIKTLEKLGIGRPSTYAPIITTIQVRQYVEKNEGKFFATNIGTAVIDFLIPNFMELFEYGFTAGMEEMLDKIAQGTKKWRQEMKVFYDPFIKLVENVEKKAERVKIEVESLGKKCPDCKEGDLVIRIGRFGKFISCSRFPDCKHTEKFIDKINMKCPDCKKGEVVIKKSKRGRKFFGCSKYPKCKWASWRKP